MAEDSDESQKVYDIKEYLEKFKDYVVNPSDFVRDKKRKNIKSGFGSVNFWTQKGTNLKCVLKKTKSPLTNAEFSRSFWREIETLIKCVHPAIIKFVGFAVVEKIGYIYLAEGKNGSIDAYFEKVKKNKVKPLDNTAKFIISYGIARTMQFLHDQDRVHRDLKLENVLLDENLHPLLTDFGTSKQLESTKQVHQTLHASTSIIMAPEFFSDPQHTSNSKPIDVYSFGITMYYLWTEIPPFAALKSNFQIYQAVIAGQRPEIPESIPDNWKELMKNCWDNNPEVRPEFSEIVEQMKTGIFYTEDMDIKSIEEYEKSIEISPEKVESTEKVKPPKETETKVKVEEIIEEAKEEEDKTEVEPEPEPEPEVKVEAKDVEDPVFIKMRQAAQSGDPASQFNYVIALVEGTYSLPDFKEALKYTIEYIKRPEAYNTENLRNTAIIECYEGRCYEESSNYKVAYKIYKTSRDHGCYDAAYRMGELMFYEKVPLIKEQLELCYRLAADSGNTDALKKYAFTWYTQGFFGNGPDKKKALEYFEKGSDMGDLEMMHQWAKILEEGRYKKRDTKKAMDLLKLASDRGYAPAMVDYGLRLYNGINIPKNEKQAKLMFQTAASLNDPSGQLWYYVLSKESELTSTSMPDEKADENLLKILGSENVPREAYGVYGRLLYKRGDIGTAMSYLFCGCSVGSFNAYTCIAKILEDDPDYGDSSFYYEIASELCHCRDTYGFTADPIKYQVYHCINCDVDICEGCAKHCHKDHSVEESIVQSGFKCGCGSEGFKNKCNAEFIGQTVCYQHLYQCDDCCPKNDRIYMCKNCAETCHKGHNVTDCGLTLGYCSCGMKEMGRNRCRLLDYDTSKTCTCGETKKQRWFQCTCGIYSNKDTGLCEACKTWCHDNEKEQEEDVSHIVLDLGVRKGTCCCRNRKCQFYE